LEHGLIHHQALPIKPKDYPAELQIQRAAFVTLTQEGQLRGCVGTLEATHPLVANVAKYAYSAGFADPRFPALTWEELPHVEIDISILSELELLRFTSENDLVEQLRPGIDGLVLEDGWYRGTLLPSVWEKTTEKRQFLRQLKRKAGLAQDYWSDNLQIKRYTTTCIS
jgi:AmmeMemoRadiSam system protein A